jgi:ribonuclease E
MPESHMLINYVPGEECRVAIVEDGKLEELYVEKFAAASRVGNIYVGKVVNVEPAIQAAFVDFGCGENGFLHVTDLHPRYFPGEGDDTTERVGFKTPRRERPPIQAALRRGDEVIVQVLKEGVGTKGPTVTSYLSIPGRFLVMMPQMDRVGVSRKVEDEDLRRQMRDILDQLELPEGFGFILRTAGLSRTKLELKRDLAYLQRLWKDMDRRLKAGGKPRLLYSESDLLVRCLRDMLTNDISQVIIDSEVALRRASRFMKIVAPRGTTKLLHFTDKTPVFHAFGIERQIALIHAREVPLPSGGRLVIDQTEALVAIDVNSGKSRESRDAETNAYQTNIEAVDEICRQLRLRDMGGIVINDLIDMRDSRHRKDIQARFDERLKRDRAKTTVLAISEFGILEMTRQRMRPSHESVHFTDCPTCRGRGMLQRPDSVAADALRDMAAILDAERVAKVEMVVAPRVASELLSTKRQLLSRTERVYSKHVDVRVSETVPVDRVSFYAYDAAGADIDAANLPSPKKPKDHLVVWEVEADTDADMGDEAPPPLEPEPEIEEDLHPIELDDPELPGEAPQPGAGQPMESEQGQGGRRRRRRRGRGRGGDRGDEQRPGQPPQQRQQQGGYQNPQRPPEPTPHQPQHTQQPGDPSIEPAPITGAPAPHDAGALPPQDGHGPADGQPADGQPGDGPRRRRRRRRGRGRGRGGEGMDNGPRPDSQIEPLPTCHTQPSPEPSPRPVDSEWGDAPVVSDNGQPPALPEHQVHIEPAPLNDEAHDDDAPGNSDQPQGQPSNQPPGPEGERQGPRRRRRRRGRGGRGGEGQGQPGQPQPHAQPQGQPQGQPPHSGRGPQAGPQAGPQGGHRGGGGGGGGQPRPPQPQRQPQPRQPMPPRAPQPQVKIQPPPPPAAPRPRTLYGASRRKLMPSEVNRKAKPE